MPTKIITVICNPEGIFQMWCIISKGQMFIEVMSSKAAGHMLIIFKGKGTQILCMLLRIDTML